MLLPRSHNRKRFFGPRSETEEDATANPGTPKMLPYRQIWSTGCLVSEQPAQDWLDLRGGELQDHFVG